jgi:molybdopterin converting factor small subunit
VLQEFSSGAAELELEADTLRALLDEVARRHPGLGSRLLTPEGRLRPYVNVFVGRHNCRALDGLDTVLAAGELVSVIPAVAGGSGHGATSAIGKTCDYRYVLKPRGAQGGP